MEIFDAYVEDLAAQEKAKEKKSTKPGAGKEEGKQKKVNAMDLQVHTYVHMYIRNIIQLKTSYKHNMIIMNYYNDVCILTEWWYFTCV